MARFGNPMLGKAFEGPMAGLTSRRWISFWALLFLVAFVGAAVTAWLKIHSFVPQTAIICGSLALVAAALTFQKPRTAPILGLVFALAAGLTVGLLAARAERWWPGIIAQGAAATAAAALGAWLIFATDNMREIGPRMAFLLTIVGALTPIAALDVNVPIFSGSASVVITVIALIVVSLGVLIDYYRVDDALVLGLPKGMGAYCAYCMLISAVWSYLEFPRLIINLFRREPRSLMRAGLRRAPQPPV